MRCARREEWHIKRERRRGAQERTLLTTPDLLLSALFSSDLMGSVGARFVRREKERERASCML